MPRLLRHLALLVLTFLPSAWVLVTNPLALPLLQTEAEGAAARIERQMGRALADGMLERRLAEAIVAADAVQVDRLMDLAETRDHALPAPLERAARAMTGADSTLVDNTLSCAACALEITNCARLSQIASCALPVEVTPLGDVNALRRQAMVYRSGDAVDRIEVGLALIGLAATAVVPLTGGSSATVKGGATLGRLALRMGTLTPGFSRVLGDAADLPVEWSLLDDFMRGAVPLERVTDTAKLARLGAISGDIGRVRAHTSITETLVLLRHVETTADLTRLTRVTEALGRRSADAFALLGKSRVFRALDEIGALGRWFGAVLVALALQVVVWVARFVLRRALRRRRAIA